MNFTKLILSFFIFIWIHSAMVGQAGRPGNLEFNYSGSLNGIFEAEKVPDPIEFPQSGTSAFFMTDSLGTTNIIIPSYQQSDGTEGAMDLFFMLMKDED